MSCIRSEIRIARFPIKLMEKVDAIDQDIRLVLAYVGGAEWLADTICRGDCISVHDDDIEALCCAPGYQCMMKIRQTKEDGAAVTTRSNEHYADRASA